MINICMIFKGTDDIAGNVHPEKLKKFHKDMMFKIITVMIRKLHVYDKVCRI